MPDSLYDRDFYSWSQLQAERLRRHAGRARDNTVDWPNVIEEIESLGRSDLQAVESLLRNMLAHLLKIALDPDDQAAGHWGAEVVAFQADAVGKFSPGMRQLIEVDLERLYATACRQARAALRRVPAQLPPACPLSLDHLLAPEFDLDEALARVRATLDLRG